MNTETVDTKEEKSDDLITNRVNYVNNLTGKFKNLFTHQYVTIVFCSFLLGYFSNGLFLSFKSNSTHNIQEIRVVNNQKNGLNIVKLDSLAVLKLQNSIDLIERENNGRFNVLSWSAYLVVLVFISFMTFNVIVSTGKVKEIVDNEIEKKSTLIEKEFNDKLIEMNGIVSSAKDELNILKELTKNINL